MSFKTYLRFAHRYAALAVLLAAMSASTTVSALQINDFGSGLQSWRFDFGGPATITHDPAQGSPGNAAGAAKMVFNFPFNGGMAFTGDLFFAGQNLTGNPLLLFDILVDPSSAHDAFGAYGYLDFVSRETDNYNWGNQTGRNLPGTPGVWQTFSVPTTSGLGMTQTRALTLQLYGGGGQNIQAPVTLWLDNIRTIPEPTSLAILAIGAAGCIGLVRGNRLHK